MIKAARDQQRFMFQRMLKTPALHPPNFRGYSAGRPNSCVTCRIASTASPREPFGARLNEIVTTGELPLPTDDQQRSGFRDRVKDV